VFKSFEWSYHTDRHQYYNDFSTRNDLYATNNREITHAKRGCESRFPLKKARGGL